MWETETTWFFFRRYLYVYHTKLVRRCHCGSSSSSSDGRCCLPPSLASYLSAAALLLSSAPYLALASNGGEGAHPQFASCMQDTIPESEGSSEKHLFLFLYLVILGNSVVVDVFFFCRIISFMRHNAVCRKKNRVRKRKKKYISKFHR